jgi:hypothetical protein
MEEEKGDKAQFLSTLSRRGNAKKEVGYPSVKCWHAGEMYLLEVAQKGMKVAGVKMLAVDVLTEDDVLGRKRQLITV